ncbi:hypothetical protein I3760_11G201500 [Carya illinoinensis]|nr:hypothetical protein I3760_11G201500 [Carya illinoinensis]
MAIFPGNIISRISSHLQFRVYFIPWVMKNNATAITCLQRRDCGSSAPVRYIPKKSSKIKKSERPLPITGSKKTGFCSDGIQKSFVFDDKKSQNQNQLLANNESFGDFEQACVDYEFIEEPKEAVEEFIFHQGKDCKQDVSCDAKTKQEAEKLAIELLATRSFTAVELRKKLQGKRFSADTVGAVINSFQSRGFINDSLYAETFSRSRWSMSSWGPRRIKLHCCWNRHC